MIADDALEIKATYAGYALPDAFPRYCLSVVSISVSPSPVYLSLSYLKLNMPMKTTGIVSYTFF